MGGPPPHRSIGIIELAGNRLQYLAAQSVTGKILMSKNLGNHYRGTNSPRTGPLRSPRTVTASVMIADWNFEVKDGCHIVPCEYLSGSGPHHHLGDALFAGTFVQLSTSVWPACNCSGVILAAKSFRAFSLCLYPPRLASVYHMYAFE